MLTDNRRYSIPSSFVVRPDAAPPVWLVLLGALLLGGPGCRRQSVPVVTPPEPPAARDTRCMLLKAAPERRAPILLAVTQAVNPAHAPVPHNDAERLVFRQLYETLVRIDCEGEIRHGLAQNWQAADGGRRWSFTLRPDARFGDGTPVRAGDVRRSWLSTRARALADGGDGPWDAVHSLSEMDPAGRTFTVTMAQPLDSPRIFADPALAITCAGADSIWPLGSGPFVCVSGGEADAGQEIAPLVCVPNRFYPSPFNPQAYDPEGRRERRPDESNELHVTIHPGADPRDLLDAGVHAILVQEYPVLDYALYLPRYLATPLPWDRIYAVTSPLLAAIRARAEMETGRPAARVESDLPLPEGFRAELARDVVGPQAREAHTFHFGLPSDPAPGNPEPWSTEAWTEWLRRSVPADLLGHAPQQVLYDRADPNGRRIAGRFVFLSSLAERPAGETPGDGFAAFARLLFGTHRAGPAVAIGLPADSLCAEFRRGRDAVFILARQPRIAAAPREAMLFAGAIPLVASRPHLVSRRALSGVRIDWDGTILLEGAGWIGESASPASGGSSPP